ncbi:MAG TPA: hypothetical protein VFL67_11030 [Mycobacterium sp.]|nr:hypothetical protein [Mycobacterium sp.]
MGRGESGSALKEGGLMAARWPMEAWALTLMEATSGSDVHLVEDHILNTQSSPLALCGVEVVKATRTSFKRSGCSGCSQAALEAGLTTIIDVNGDLVDIRSLLDDDPA